MKITLFSLLFASLAALASAAPPQFQNVLGSPKLLGNNIREALEKFRELMITGDPSRGIPIMDPFKLDEFGFGFNSSYLSMSVNSSKNVITGLSKFIIHNVDMSLSPLEITFDVTLPKTVIDSETYDFYGMVFQALPIYGKGKAFWEVGNLYADGRSKVVVGLNGVSLRDLDLQLNVTSVLSETTGMLGGGDIDTVINAIIQDLIPGFLNMNSKSISLAISDFILEKLNIFLDGMSLADFIELITG